MECEKSSVLSGNASGTWDVENASLRSVKLICFRQEKVLAFADIRNLGRWRIPISSRSQLSRLQDIEPAKLRYLNTRARFNNKVCLDVAGTKR